MTPPPPGARPFDTFSRDVFTVLLLNTVNQLKGKGISYTDFQRIDGIPHSKVYRILKKLEEKGSVDVSEERVDIGRPRQRYHLTSRGERELAATRERVRDLFETFRYALPAMLEEGTFETFRDFFPLAPGAHGHDKCVLDPAERLDFLLDMENDLNEHLDRVRAEIDSLRASIDGGEGRQ